MDVVNVNTTFINILSALDTSADASPSSWTVLLASFLTPLVCFLAYLSYTPSVIGKIPEYTTNKLPFVGSWSFFTQRWAFFRDSAKRSKTGNFSFWLGKYHVVGVSGEAARKAYLDNRVLNFDNGYATLHGIGPELMLPIHEIFEPKFQGGRSYFHRRLIDLTRSDQLAKRLPALLKDTRTTIEGLAKTSKPITNPFFLNYKMTTALSSRTIGSDEIANDPKVLQAVNDYCLILQGTCSADIAAVPWLPRWSFAKRAYARWGLHSIIAPIVSKRMKKGAIPRDDALQVLINNGDSKDYIINFYISTLFAALVNTGVLAGGLLTVMSHMPSWQDKIFAEIQSVLSTHSKDKNASILDQLDLLPLEAWESSFPTIDVCFKELIRMNAAFPMFRKNMSDKAIPIPGTDEVIPAGSFACYHTANAHYDEEVFPNPWHFDPDRFGPERDEYKKQTYAFVGWGAGRHPCLGMRWAKLQQNIVLVYALAQWKWSACNADGGPLPPMEQSKDLDVHMGLPEHIFTKYVPREV